MRGVIQPVGAHGPPVIDGHRVKGKVQLIRQTEGHTLGKCAHRRGLFRLARRPILAKMEFNMPHLHANGIELYYE